MATWRLEIVPFEVVRCRRFDSVHGVDSMRIVELDEEVGEVLSETLFKVLRDTKDAVIDAEDILDVVGENGGCGLNGSCATKWSRKESVPSLCMVDNARNAGDQPSLNIGPLIVCQRHLELDVESVEELVEHVSVRCRQLQLGPRDVEDIVVVGALLEDLTCDVGSHDDEPQHVSSSDNDELCMIDTWVLNLMDDILRRIGGSLVVDDTTVDDETRMPVVGLYQVHVDGVTGNDIIDDIAIQAAKDKLGAKNCRCEERLHRL